MGFTGKILSRKDLRAAEGGWESPEETRFGSSRVVTVTYQTLLETQKGRSARLGGSCPTSGVWVRWATRSSYESSNWRSYFASLPRTGMRVTGRSCTTPAPRARKMIAQCFNGGWSGKRKRVPRDGTGFCSGIWPRPAKTGLERGTPGLGSACIYAWPGHPAPGVPHCAPNRLPERERKTEQLPRGQRDRVHLVTLFRF